MYFGCAPLPKSHSEWVWSEKGFIFIEYNIHPVLLSDDGVVCKCTGRWSPQPVMYTLSTSVTLRVVDLNGSAVLSTSRTTLSGRTSSLSASETVTFTPRNSLLTSSEAPIRDLNASAPLGVSVTPYTHVTQGVPVIPDTLATRDNQPDDHFKSNVYIVLGIIGVLLLAVIIIGVFGLRKLNMREKKPEQNGPAPRVEPYLIESAQSGYNYDSISSLKSDRSSLPLHDSEIKPHFLHLENGSYLTAGPLNV